MNIDFILYCNAIDELAELDLLPSNLNKEQVKELIIGKYQIYCNSFYDNNNYNVNNNISKNYFCLTSGEYYNGFNPVWFHNIPFKILYLFSFYLARLGLLLDLFLMVDNALILLQIFITSSSVNTTSEKPFI